MSGRQQAGARLALLQATALRLVALGRLPATTVVGRTYAPTLKKAVVAFQRACRCKARSSAPGTIDAGTKKALDAQLYALRRAWRAG